MEEPDQACARGSSRILLPSTEFRSMEVVFRAAELILRRSISMGKQAWSSREFPGKNVLESG